MKSAAAKAALALAVCAAPTFAVAGLVRPAAAVPGFVRPPSLLGQTVAFHILYQSTETTDDVVVTGKPEISCPGSFNACAFLNAQKVQTITIGANTITYKYRGPGAFFQAVNPNAMYFEGLNLPKPIVGVELKTNIPNLTSANVSFTGTTVQVNMSGITIPGPYGYYHLILQTHV
jgi:hypothetical protein